MVIKHRNEQQKSVWDNITMNNRKQGQIMYSRTQQSALENRIREHENRNCRFR